jgi:hypothetical protein
MAPLRAESYVAVICTLPRCQTDRKTVFLAPGLARVKRGTERFILERSAELDRVGLDAATWGTSEGRGIDVVPAPARTDLQEFARDRLHADADQAAPLSRWMALLANPGEKAATRATLDAFASVQERRFSWEFVTPQYVEAFEKLVRSNDWATIQTVLANPHEAEQGFRRALALDPNHAQTAANLGAVLAAANRFAGAIPLPDGEGIARTRPPSRKVV